MPVQVGDAELNFLGNTLQLDQVLDTMPQRIKTKLKPAKDEILGLGQNWQFAGRTASLAGDAAEEFGNKVIDIGTKTRKSSQEARGSIDLLGEQFGVRLPRELKSFLSQLPGVSGALKAAFNISVVAAFASVVVDAALKLNQFYIDTFVFTEEMKRQDAIFGQLNETLSKSADHLRETNKEFNLLGKEGAARTLEQFNQLLTGPGGLNEQQRALDNINGQLFLNGNGVVNLTQIEKEQFIEQKKILTTTLADGWKQAAIIQETYTKQLLAEEQAYQEARISGARNTSLAINEARRQGALRDAQLFEAGSNEIELINLKYNDRVYEIDRKALVDRQALLEKDPTRNKPALSAIYAQIEDLDLQHQAKLEEQQAARIKKFQEDIKALQIPSITMSIILPNTSNAFGEFISKSKELRDILTGPGSIEDSIREVDRAFQVLGLSDSSFELAKRMGAEQAAIEELTRAQRDGLITATDLDRARLQLIQTEIQAIAVSNVDIKTKKAQTAALEQQAITIQRRLVPQITVWKTIQRQASQDITSAVGQVAQAYASGAASMGQALKQGLATFLETVASQSLVSAIVELAKGFAALSPTSPDFGHAGEHFTAAAIFGTVGAAAAVAGRAVSGGGAQPGQTGGGSENTVSPVTQPEQNPVSSTQVQRFATSALVTRPTVAMIGDGLRGGGSREGIFNLDDPYAMAIIGEAVAGALADRMPAGDTHNHFHIKGDLIDLNKLGSKLSKGVDKGTVRLKASNSNRVTRKA